MTVKELKAKLNSFDDDLIVLVRGYEDGFNDISEIREIKIKLNVNEHWFEGDHEESDDADTREAIAFLGSNKNAKD